MSCSFSRNIFFELDPAGKQCPSAVLSLSLKNYAKLWEHGGPGGPAMQHGCHSHAGVQFWIFFPACWSTWWSGKHPTISRASFILLGANALQPKHMYHIHVSFAMCVYIKAWNGKRKHKSGKNSIEHPVVDHASQREVREKKWDAKLRSGLMKCLGPWEIMQFFRELSSYHPALAQLGYQDSSWIM